MKKCILMGAALLSLFVASCSNEDIIGNGSGILTGKTITLNANINNGADTKLTYNDNGSMMSLAWSDNETFTMYKGTISKGSPFTNTSENTGKFKGNDISGEGDYYAVYGNNISNNNGALTIDLSTQVGTNEDNGIKEFMLATADALTNETSLEFKHKLTVLKLTLTIPEGETGTTASQVTVSGLHNKATYTLSADAYDAYADADKGDITATNGGTGFAIASHKITAYVAVFPEDVAANQVTIKAIVGDNEYSYTIANARTLQENQVVPVKVTLAAPKKNFKSEYTKDDYKSWSDENCGSAATYEQMMMYLGAGVYWDEGTDNNDGNQQTYTLPNGETYHAGLWVMKKAYIDDFSAGSAKQVKDTELDGSCFYKGRPDKSEIGKYFFLPAAGYYNNSKFGAAGSFGRYWSRSPVGDDRAYGLIFDNSLAYVGSSNRAVGLLPMVAE